MPDMPEYLWSSAIHWASARSRSYGRAPNFEETA